MRSAFTHLQIHTPRVFTLKQCLETKHLIANLRKRAGRSQTFVSFIYNFQWLRTAISEFCKHAHSSRLRPQLGTFHNHWPRADLLSFYYSPCSLAFPQFGPNVPYLFWSSIQELKNQKSHLLNPQRSRHMCEPDLMQRHSAAGQSVVTYVNCCSLWRTPSSTPNMRTKHWGLRTWAKRLISRVRE